MRSVLLVIITAYGALAQSSPEFKPSFAAVVVSNVDNSSTWYKSVLRLSTKKQMIDPQGNYRIQIVGNDTFELELLEMKGSISRATVLAGKPAGTQVQGHFKIGFNVSNMDGWLLHLSNQKVTVPQVWTDANGKRNFLITDPDGNLIQFFEK